MLSLRFLCSLRELGVPSPAERICDGWTGELRDSFGLRSPLRRSSRFSLKEAKSSSGLRLMAFWCRRNPSHQEHSWRRTSRHVAQCNAWFPVSSLKSPLQCAWFVMGESDKTIPPINSVLCSDRRSSRRNEGERNRLLQATKERHCLWRDHFWGSDCLWLWKKHNLFFWAYLTLYGSLSESLHSEACCPMFLRLLPPQPVGHPPSEIKHFPPENCWLKGETFPLKKRMVPKIFMGNFFGRGSIFLEFPHEAQGRLGIFRTLQML